MERYMSYFLEHFLAYLGTGLGIFIPLALFTLIIKRIIVNLQANIKK